MRRLCLLLAAVLLLPATALATPDRAAGGSSATPEEKFKNMDKNGDGNLAPEEFFAAYPQMHEAAFKSIDKDGDNLISKEEWLNFSGSHSRDMGGQGGMMMTKPRGMGGAQPATDSAPDGRKPLFELRNKDEQPQ